MENELVSTTCTTIPVSPAEDYKYRTTVVSDYECCSRYVKSDYDENRDNAKLQDADVDLFAAIIVVIAAIIIVALVGFGFYLIFK